MPDTMFTRRHGRTGQLSRGTILASALLLGLGALTPARAQFNFFGAREVSAEDVSETIADHGFRLVGPLYRNGRVYLADVIDRRQRRERLVISAENGQIVQRFMVDVGPERRPPAYVSRAAPQDDSFFSHLTRGWDDAPPPRPPLGLDAPERLPSAIAPAQPRLRPQPRIVTRTDPGPAPVTSSPLPPPSSVVPGPTPQTPAASKPETVAVPTTASTTASTPPASNVRGTSVSTDPLRIPGARKAEEAKATPAAAVATKAPDPTPAPAKPKPAAPATADVPVAPLD